MISDSLIAIIDMYADSNGNRTVNISGYARSLPVKVLAHARELSGNGDVVLLNIDCLDMAFNEVRALLLSPFQNFLDTFQRKRASKTVSYVLCLLPSHVL